MKGESKVVKVDCSVEENGGIQVPRGEWGIMLEEFCGTPREKRGKGKAKKINQTSGKGIRDFVSISLS